MSTAGPQPLSRVASWWSRRPPWPDLLLYLALLAQGVVALVVAGRGWFSGDVIHYFTERGGLPDGSESLSDPHQGHWQPVLIVVYRVLFELFGLRTYVPFVLLTLLVHLLIVVLLYFLLIRLGVERRVALVAGLLVLTYGAGSEAFLVEAPVALTAAVALGLVAVTVLLRSDFAPRSVLVTNVLLLAAVMLSIGGVVAAVWVGCFALGRGVRSMLSCVAAPAVAFTTWYLWRGRDGGRLYIEGKEWLEVPRGAATLLTQPFGDLVTVASLGGTLLVAVFAGVLLGAKRLPALATLALAGMLAAGVHATLSAVAQVPFGMDQVLTSRYRYIVLVLLAPAAALAAQVVVQHLRSRVPSPSRPLVALVLGAVAVGGLVNAAAEQHKVSGLVADAGETTKTRLRGMIAAISTGERPINDAVGGDYISGFDLERLADPRAGAELPDLEGDQEDRIEAESKYFVAVTSEELDVEVPAPSRLESASFTSTLVATPGCRNVLATSATPALTLTSFSGAAVTVTSNASTVTTTLDRPELGVRGASVSWKVEPGEQLTIATTAQVARLEVAFDSGDYYRVCVP
ncbi:MAG: hypothetical protein JWM84_573 [Nocardioides sp.]|nr:hypothetical protein [Nocardioides sp.]